jgi:dihydroneopterin aldolase
MECITIAGLELFARHGVNPEERRDGQVFLLDLELWAELGAACASDRLEDTLNYAQVLKRAAQVFCEAPCNLIEHAAERVANAILLEFPAADHLRLRVHKPDAPIKLRVADISITIERGRIGSNE